MLSQADFEAKEELQRWRSRRRRQVEAGFGGADRGGVLLTRAGSWGSWQVQIEKALEEEESQQWP